MMSRRMKVIPMMAGLLLITATAYMTGCGKSQGTQQSTQTEESGKANIDEAAAKEASNAAEKEASNKAGDETGDEAGNAAEKETSNKAGDEAGDEAGNAAGNAAEKEAENAAGNTAGNKTAEDTAEKETANTGEKKPSFGTFTAKDLDGQEITQDVFQDAKVTMINVWGTFCGPCISEMPELGELAAEYKDKDLQIIGIPVDVSEGNNEDTARDIVEQTKADYIHIVPSQDLSSGILGGVQVVPTTIFVNQDGEILNVYTGARSKDEWIELMDQELEV